MIQRSCPVKGHTRRVPSKPQVWIDKHAELRREVDELRIDAMGDLLADALMMSLMEEDAR